MIIDNHVHVGWFTDGYHAPREVWYSEMAAGIDGMAVASTSTCAELYKDVCRELRELVRLGGNRVFPLLWLTPRMMKIKYALPYMLHSKIKWKGVKIHSQAHPEWTRNPLLLNKGLNIARMLDVPVLFHTGEYECCRAKKFLNVIKQNSDLTFVLAHARPIEEAMLVLRSCNNVYVDLSFVSKDDIKTLYNSGFKNRMLFGTDAPINKVFYKSLPTSEFILQHINETMEICNVDALDIFSRTVYQ